MPGSVYRIWMLPGHAWQRIPDLRLPVDPV